MEEFTELDQTELSRLCRKIDRGLATITDMELADGLTRRKWKSEGIN